MFVRLLTSMAGPSGAWTVGDLYECDEPTARRLVAAGYAVPTDVGPVPVVVETAMAEGGPEQAVRPRGRRKA
jgi:hypothetical protein